MEPSRRLILGDDGNARPEITPLTILEEVAVEFHVSRAKLKAHRKGSRRVCFARDELARRLWENGYSQREVGEFLGGRTVPCISVAIRRAKKRLAPLICEQA